MGTPLSLDRSICTDFEQTTRREWLETNGLGGFATSTISGANTRRYHGLLTASIEPLIRYLLLSKLEETLVVAGQRFELSTNTWPDTVSPRGYQFLIGFRIDPVPVFTFEAGGVILEKRVFLVNGENTVVIEYVLEGDADAELELRPLIAFRGYHELTHRNPALDGTLDEKDGAFSIQPYAGLPRLYFAHNARQVDHCGDWYLNFEYPIEKDRGLDFREDLYCPCILRFDLKSAKKAAVMASTLDHRVEDAERLKAVEILRRAALGNLMETAANQFVAKRGAQHTVIAGYPWFADWGRDTMIALPGLTLTARRFDVARDILRGYASCLDHGLLPNTLPVQNEPPAYNSIDAALWLFEALRLYVKYSADLDFIREDLYKPLVQVIESYAMRMDCDGLIQAGDASTQLTWMDARVNGVPVTPRNGKPVEIQALWYNALRIMQSLASKFSDVHGGVFFESLAPKAGASLNDLFWNEAGGYFYDVVRTDNTGDASLRPNQLIAMSLGFCAIEPGRARCALSSVRQKLLTPYGLRTLAPDDPHYRGRCEGPPETRDAAYHQGTVWPWLLGPFIAASLRFSAMTREDAAAMTRPLIEYAESRGCGQIPEIFDGDPPHEPRGCYAQAWSVAEILRFQPLNFTTSLNASSEL